MRVGADPGQASGRGRTRPACRRSRTAARAVCRAAAHTNARCTSTSTTSISRSRTDGRSTLGLSHGRVPVARKGQMPVLPNPPREARSATRLPRTVRGRGAASTMPWAIRSPAATRTGLVGDVDHLDLHLVGRAAVVGVDDADAVGDHQPALQRRAAARQDGQEVAGGHLDDQAGRHEGDARGAAPRRRRRRPGRRRRRRQWHRRAAGRRGTGG